MREPSRHNYTNPAFCQQSEFYQSPSSSTTPSTAVVKKISPVKVHRSASSRSIHVQQQRTLVRNAIGHSSNQLINLSSPPKPGPKPPQYGEIKRNTQINNSGRYALVPVEDLPSGGGHNAVILSPQVSNFVKSQHNLDRYASLPIPEEPPAAIRNTNVEDQYTSLPQIVSNEPGKLSRAFSSDFGSKSLVLVDPKSLQCYTFVETEDNEELVDDNHEVIQMQNGRTHRYAMIPTDEELDDDEKETCLSSREFENSPANQHHGYATIRESQSISTINNTPEPKMTSTPQKMIYSPQHTPNKMVPQQAITVKNLATQRLHELLSTPPKSYLQQQSQSTPRKNPPPHLIKQRPTDYTPQKLQYDQKIIQDTPNSHLEKRTTAVITPRLLAPSSVYSETTSESHNKSWTNLSYQNVRRASFTIAIVSLMLVICGVLNTGLTIYLIYYHGKTFFMEMALTAGIAATFLGIQGFRTRKYVTLPNRNYISGHLLVTIFSLFKCCCLLVLLTLKPFPGTPIHDVTSGIILGLSTLTLLLISLGIVISKWCATPPPDNRVDLY